MIVQGFVIRHKNSSIAKDDTFVLGGYVPEIAGYHGEWIGQSTDFSSVMASKRYPVTKFHRLTIPVEGPLYIDPILTFYLPEGWQNNYEQYKQEAIEISDIIFRWLGDVTVKEVFQSVEGFAYRFHSQAFLEMANDLCPPATH